MDTVNGSTRGSLHNPDILDSDDNNRKTGTNTLLGFLAEK